jgi:hypothetical protein
LFENGINQKVVFELIDELLSDKTIINEKQYIETQNAFESELMLWKRGNTNTYKFDKFLKTLLGGFRVYGTIK